MSDELPANLRPIADFFGLVGTAAVAKDFHVVRAIAALNAVDAVPFSLVFGGGTALARAHRLVRRMSEDVDFKIVPGIATPDGRTAQHRQRSALRDRITAALVSCGFAAQARSRNESRYTVYELPYAAAETADGLRPTILVELTYAPLRIAPITCAVSSFVAEALGRPPEVPTISCVSVTETAAEKLIALTRKTAMELAGLIRDPDPALVRHIYDLHMMREHLDPKVVAALARDIATSDALQFRNQYPAYAEDIEGETSKAVKALRTGPLYRDRYERFMAGMVYGEQASFDQAFGTVVELTTIFSGHTLEI